MKEVIGVMITRVGVLMMVIGGVNMCVDAPPARLRGLHSHEMCVLMMVLFEMCASHQ